MKKWLLLLFIVIVALVLAFPVKTLTISSNHSIKYVFMVRNGNEFALSWIHSVEKERWLEYFKVKGKNMVLDYTRFKTFGAGVPSHVGKRSYLKNGWVYMVGINRMIGPNLNILTNPITHHDLIINNKTYPLSNPKHDIAYTLSIKKASLITILYHHIRG